MPGVPCRYCGATLDSYGEFCGCPGSVEARTPDQSDKIRPLAPIATKRIAAFQDELSQYKGD